MTLPSITYPTKDSNSSSDSEKKFFDTEANEIKTVVNAIRDKAQELDENQVDQSPNPYYGRWATLALLQAAHPTGVVNAFAIIDSGLGVTPQIAAWDNIEGIWELTTSTNSNIVFVSSESQLPSTGVINTFYITQDRYDAYIYNTEYHKLSTYQRNPILWLTKTISEKGTITDTNVSNYNIKIGVTGGFIDSFYFDTLYSLVLQGVKVRYDLGEVVLLPIYNMTKKTTIYAKVNRSNGFVFNGASDEYTKLNVNNIDASKIDLDDVLQIFLPYTQLPNYTTQTFTATADQTVFDLGPNPPSELDLVIVGRSIAIETTDYTYSSGTLTFVDQQIVGTLITVKYYE